MVSLGGARSAAGRRGKAPRRDPEERGKYRHAPCFDQAAMFGHDRFYVEDRRVMIMAGKAGKAATEPIESALCRPRKNEHAVGPQEWNETADELGNVLVMLQRIQGEDGGEAVRLRLLKRGPLRVLPFSAGA